VDGRPHLEQVRPVLAARKPVFIDKPIAGNLADAAESKAHGGQPVELQPLIEKASAGKVGPR